MVAGRINGGGTSGAEPVAPLGNLRSSDSFFDSSNILW